MAAHLTLLLLFWLKIEHTSTFLLFVNIIFCKFKKFPLIMFIYNNDRITSLATFSFSGTDPMVYPEASSVLSPIVHTC